jgi:ribonuclease HII
MSAARHKSRGLELIAHDRALAAEEGLRFVAGCDEAGRGSLAGPLVAAAVCLDLDCLPETDLALLDDSKRLKPPAREQLFEAVIGCAAAVSIQIVEAAEIDREGLHRMNLRALALAIDAVTPPAELRLSDYYKLEAAVPVIPITRGDSISAAIAAASILAKVTRDRLMHAYHDNLYPQYGFDAHVGYRTSQHAAAVVRYGPSPLHRLSFNARCYEEHRQLRESQEELEELEGRGGLEELQASFATPGHPLESPR